MALTYKEEKIGLKPGREGGEDAAGVRRVRRAQTHSSLYSSTTHNGSWLLSLELC